MHIAYIGNLQNARRLAHTLQPAGYQVIAFDPAEHFITPVTEGALTAVPLLHDLAENVPSKRIVLIDLPSTPVVDEALEELRFCLTVGDIIIHIQQAPPHDTVRRARDLEGMQIYLLDCILPENNTAANIAVGGNRFAFNDSLPLLQAMVPDATYRYGGRTGAGHAAAQGLTHNHTA
jgi:6-phosphogluconate dehydrogenase